MSFIKGREKMGEGESSVGGGEEGGKKSGRVGSAEGEEAAVFEEVGETGKGGFESGAGG